MARSKKKDKYPNTFSLWFDLEEKKPNFELEVEKNVATITIGAISFKAYCKNPDDQKEATQLAVNISAYDDEEADGISVGATARFVK